MILGSTFPPHPITNLIRPWTTSLGPKVQTRIPSLGSLALKYAAKAPLNAANAVGSKTARACDSCIRKRARWYCAADDAFLCQSCDSLVHSANSLARRHERLRLKTASFKSSSASSDVVILAAMDPTLAPSWHRGFTKKARTPRHGKNQSSTAHHYYLGGFRTVTTNLLSALVLELLF